MCDVDFRMVKNDQLIRRLKVEYSISGAELDIATLQADVLLQEKYPSVIKLGSELQQIRALRRKIKLDREELKRQEDR